MKQEEDETASPAKSRPSWVPALAVTIALVSAGAYWFVSRHRGRLLGRDLFERATVFSGCMARVRDGHTTLRDAISFTSPRALPLASCQHDFVALRNAHSKLLDLGLRRDRAGVDELGRQIAALAAIRFSDTSADLLRADLTVVESNAAGTARSSCRIAIAEGSIEIGGCAVPAQEEPPPALARARVIADETIGWLESAAFAIDTRADRLRLMLVMRDRDQARLQARLLDSTDRGEHFGVSEFELGAAQFGAPEEPRLQIDSGGALRRAVVLQRTDREGYSAGSVLDFAEDGRPGQSWSVPAMPQGLEPVRTGTPVFDLLEKKMRRPAVVLAPSDPGADGGAVLVVEDAGKTRTLAMPVGRLLAAIATTPPGILVADKTGDGKSSITYYALAEPGKPWLEGDRVVVPAGVIQPEPAAQASCGPPGENLFPFVARHDSKSMFLAVGSERIHASRFDRPPGSDLTVLCGSCPPALLARSEAELGMMSPLGKDVAPMSIDVPCLLSETKAGRSARAACSSRTTSVAFVSEGRVIVQTTRAESEGFDGPHLLAEPDAEGTPTAVWVTTIGERTLVIWRRDRERRQHLRLELAMSDDAGRTWR